MSDEIIDVVQKNLNILAYVAITTSFMTSVYKFRSQGIGERMLYFVGLIAFLAFYNVCIDWGVDVMEELTKSTSENIKNKLEELSKYAGMKPEGYSWVDDAVFKFRSFIINAMITCCGVFKSVSIYFQKFFIVAMKVFAPIMIGLAAWEPFKHLLVKLVTFTMATCMWRLGFVIGDVIIIKMYEGSKTWEKIKSLEMEKTIDATFDNAVVGMALLVFLVMGVFYIFSPMIIFTLLNGGNPAAATASLIRTSALTTMSLGNKGIAMAGAANKMASGRNNPTAPKASGAVAGTSTDVSPNRAPTASGRIAARMREMQQKQRLNK
jgi:hypothetical protein